MSGKGSKPRTIPDASYRDSHDRIFGKKLDRCHKCGGEITEGIAMRQTFDVADEGTISYGGPGKLGSCWKCRDCGHSFTKPES